MTPSHPLHWRQRVRRSTVLPIWDYTPISGRQTTYATIYSSGTGYVLQTCDAPGAGYPWTDHGTHETLAVAQAAGKAEVEARMAGAGR